VRDIPLLPQCISQLSAYFVLSPKLERLWGWTRISHKVEVVVVGDELEYRYEERRYE
jgi:hypothetical protein